MLLRFPPLVPLRFMSAEALNELNFAIQMPSSPLQRENSVMKDARVAGKVLVLLTLVGRQLEGLVCRGGLRKSQGFAVCLATAHFACMCCVGGAAIKLYLYGVSQRAGWEVTVRGCEHCL